MKRENLEMDVLKRFKSIVKRKLKKFVDLKELYYRRFDPIEKLNEDYDKLNPEDRDEIKDWDCTLMDGLEDE